MHNNIMADGSRDLPPMLATRRYAQWRSRFLRYIDTRPNGDALRKCILKGPYTPTILTTPALSATENFQSSEQTKLSVFQVQSPSLAKPDPSRKAHMPLMAQGYKRTLSTHGEGVGYHLHSKMEMKDTLSSCSNSEEQQMQQIQDNAKKSCMVSFRQLHSHLKLLSHNDLKGTRIESGFKHAFAILFGQDVETFIGTMFLNVKQLEKQLDKEEFQEIGSMAAFKVLETQFQMFIKSLIYLDDEYVVMTRNYFLQYTQLVIPEFHDTLIQHMESCTVQEVKASEACSGEKDRSRIVSDNGNVQDLETQSNTSGDESSRSRNKCNDKSISGVDTDIRPTYDTETMVENDQNVVDCDDERVALANLSANLKLDVDNNKTIQKQLKKANASLTQELNKCKSILAKTSRTLGESNNIRDSCLVALQNKQTEFERYKAFNDRTVDYDKLERKLNETLGLLAQKEIDIKEGLKLKAYEISVVKEKHDE
ncbi:hypothetical protein Tco_0772123 [Tanacetum coccineum]|uniref:Uncharacterized protein n=1 Tax=Tanacetum coccineum TaxID=301880 RepID=A0ABQ4ZKM8_9ASTR